MKNSTKQISDIDIEKNNDEFVINSNSCTDHNGSANDDYSIEKQHQSIGKVQNETHQQQQQPNHQPTFAKLNTNNTGHVCWGRDGNRNLISITWISLIVIVVLFVVVVFYSMDWIGGYQAVTVAAVAVVAATSIWHWMGNWIYIAIITAPRDIRAVIRFIRLLVMTKSCERNNQTVGDIFEEQVEKHPDKICFVLENKEWTFREVNELSNRMANHFQNNGYKCGDVVGLFVENRPEYIAFWLGLSKIGVITALINTNLRNAALQHSINIVNCKGLIYTESLSSVVEEISDKLEPTLEYYQYNDTSDNVLTKVKAQELRTLLNIASTSPIVVDLKEQRHHKKLLYIYTSGTTGLSKAAVITHSRYIFISAGIHYIGGFRDDDIFYLPLPLYHTAGGVMNGGQALLFGSKIVLRKKFSASAYFPDCQKYKCTVIQYIGEMCRYVLATQPSEADKNHCVRLAFGNGLRPQIWPQFVERFNLSQIVEFYGATEGNANIVNVDNTVGAVGFISRIIPNVYPISVIRADPLTGEPIRGPDGLCQLCKVDEPGVFIGKIIPGNPTRAFLGYVDKKASSKKVVHDIFKKGDSAFLSGDIVVCDERGNLFFKDRTGDTFRWKGENVSTIEVEALISNIIGYRDAVVYGVEVQDLEGRAGMVAILDPENEVDLKLLADGVKKVLPAYARPLFVRLLSKVDMTGTFKLKKLDLQKECFDPNIITDRLFYLTPKGNYETLNVDIYNEILKGEIRF